MSGGHFDYQQYRISDIAEEIRNIIKNNDVENEFGNKRGYSNETIKKFWKAVELLEEGAIYAQRIDWLLSGDDGEDSFHKRLREDLAEISA